jgi:hypothetical protein
MEGVYIFLSAWSCLTLDAFKLNGLDTILKDIQSPPEITS